MNEPAETTCVTCQHWRPTGEPSVVVNQAKRGECRRQIEVVVMPGGIVSLYPPVTDRFPSCGHYETTAAAALAAVGASVLTALSVDAR